MCGKSVIRNILYAKQLGYAIELQFVGVESVDIAKQRIEHRVAQGGHGIPDEDIERRFAESLRQLKEVFPLCDLAVLYDNTITFKRVAVFQNGKNVFIEDDVPKWYKDLLINEQ